MHFFFISVGFSTSCDIDSKFFLVLGFQSSVNQRDPNLQATDYAQTITSIYFLFFCDRNYCVYHVIQFHISPSVATDIYGELVIERY
jgi:hypothetical protein